MNSLQDEVLTAIHSVWNRRWLALAVAWGVCLVGWLIVALIPNSYESKARIFAQLDDAARQAYLQANSIEGVREASVHPDNIACLVAVDADSGRIVGYRLVRRGVHRLDGQPVAEGKRLHVARDLVGNGLGAALVEISAQIARQCGHSRMTAQASGNSRQFFEKLGFRCVLEQARNDVLELSLIHISEPTRPY